MRSGCVTWRTFDLTDAAANTLGATAGYALALVVLAALDPARRRPGARASRRRSKAWLSASTFFSIRPSGAPPKMCTWKCGTS